MISKLSLLCWAVFGSLTAIGATASDASEFIFSGNSVFAAENPTKVLKVGARISIAQLTDLFSSAAVTLSNECDGFCLIVTKNEIQLQVYYDQDTQTVTSVIAYGEGSADIAGNKSGDPVTKAIGASSADCDFGEVTTCASHSIEGLRYVLEGSDVEGKDDCPQPAPEKAPSKTQLADCLKIGGFEIVSRHTDVSTNEQAEFTKFPAEGLFKGPTRYPDFRRRDREFVDYRTRIRDGLKSGPNFAGHYSLIQIGCGTDCSFVYVSDNKTGKVFNFPRGGEDNLDLQLAYRPNSRLLIVQWANYDEDKCVVESFEWKKEKAILLNATVIGKRELCLTRDLPEAQ
jgi:hypothetical protein